jgi:hypothetical protein
LKENFVISCLLPKYTQNSDPTFYLAFTGNGNWESLKVQKTKTKLKQREQNKENKRNS